MPSRHGSLISAGSETKFHSINRARSASGYDDDYYAESEERSFICSKPGFVCLAAVLFTVSFITLAYFLETGMPWQNQRAVNVTHVVPPKEIVSGAGLVVAHKEIVEDTPDTLYIFTPFDDRKKQQNHVLRALMDAQKFGDHCSQEFDFSKMAEFLKIPSSSESQEANNFNCVDLSEAGFQKMSDHFKHDMKKRSKYIFVIRDPRSLVYPGFDKHGPSLVNCKGNPNHRCLYDEELLGNAKKTMVEWNALTDKMIDVCSKLTVSNCQIVLLERLKSKLSDTLSDLANFLMMDFEKDTFRMLDKMIRKIDEGSVEGESETEKKMIDFLEFLIPDISGTWPWVGKLPYNFFEHLSTWAPNMGKLGYGFSTEHPSFTNTFNLSELLKRE